MAELGDTLVLEVVATNAAGTGTAYSPPTNAISEAPVNKVPPALSTDNPVVGSVVTVSKRHLVCISSHLRLPVAQL